MRAVSLLSTVPTAADYVEAAIEARTAGDHARAMSLCMAAIELEPRSLPAWLLRADIDADAADWPRVLRMMDDLAREHPSNARIAFRRALALANLHRIEEALDGFEEASLLDPYDARPWLQRALLLQRMGRADEAADCRARAEELALPEIQ